MPSGFSGRPSRSPRRSAPRASKAEKKYAGKTTERHVALLDGIGLDWDPQETAWAKLLAQLVAFKEESGGCTPCRGAGARR